MKLEKTIFGYRSTKRVMYKDDAWQMLLLELYFNRIVLVVLRTFLLHSEDLEKTNHL